MEMIKLEAEGAFCICSPRWSSMGDSGGRSTVSQDDLPGSDARVSGGRRVVSEMSSSSGIWTVTSSPEEGSLRSHMTFPETPQQRLGPILERSEGLYDMPMEMSQQRFVSILTWLHLNQLFVEGWGKSPLS